jgi:DNA-binding LacI/PurR family transcriptional regulator
VAVRLKDVALRAGVSVRTVSNVVHEFRHVAPATRARVQAALDELGYRPNIAARQLRGGRTGLVALVIPELDSPYFSDLAARLTDEAEQRGWTLLVDQTRGDPERELRLLRADGRHHVDGVIFSPWGVDPRALDPQGLHVPMVVLGEQEPAGMFDHVAVDSVAAGAEAARHLLAAGRERVAAIGAQPHRSNATAAQRLAGYRAALDEAAVEYVAALVADVRTLHRHDGAAAMRRLLEQAPDLDAVFCFTDELALGALRTLHRDGIKVPDDVALLGFDDIEDGRFSTPTLSTIAPDKPALAGRALELLEDRLARPDADARTETIAHTLVVRESS